LGKHISSWIKGVLIVTSNCLIAHNQLIPLLVAKRTHFRRTNEPRSLLRSSGACLLLSALSEED